MPPMSRPLMTAWATVSNIAATALLRLDHRSAGKFLREDAGEIAVLPLHADRAAVDVLAVGPEFYFAAGRHRGIAGGDVERRQRLAHFHGIGGSRALQRVRQHEGLRHQAAGIFEQEVAGALLVLDV